MGGIHSCGDGDRRQRDRVLVKEEEKKKRKKKKRKNSLQGEYSAGNKINSLVVLIGLGIGLGHWGHSGRCFAERLLEIQIDDGRRGRGPFVGAQDVQLDCAGLGEQQLQAQKDDATVNDWHVSLVEAIVLVWLVTQWMFDQAQQRKTPRERRWPLPTGNLLRKLRSEFSLSSIRVHLRSWQTVARQLGGRIEIDEWLYKRRLDPIEEKNHINLSQRRGW